MRVCRSRVDKDGRVMAVDLCLTRRSSRDERLLTLCRFNRLLGGRVDGRFCCLGIISKFPTWLIESMVRMARWLAEAANFLNFDSLECLDGRRGAWLMLMGLAGLYAEQSSLKVPDDSFSIH